MKDWRELFSDDALVEGWELYLDGRVENLEVFDEDGKFYELSATVYEELPAEDDEEEEEEEFEVYSEIENGEIVEIECDCHEAVEGNFCRHMAAAYYEYEDVYETPWDDLADDE